jgi:CRP/FNR family cyclic AMP-dependent transcriptional regulator
VDHAAIVIAAPAAVTDSWPGGRYRPAMLRKEEKVELLARLPLFENCTRKELRDIASIMVEADRPAGAVLTREGQDGGLMFVLLEGQADVLAARPNGSSKPKVIGRLKDGDVVGELSLIDGRARSATVVASTPVRVLQLATDDFQVLVHKSSKFRKALLQALSMRVREMDELTS